MGIVKLFDENLLSKRVLFSVPGEWLYAFENKDATSAAARQKQWVPCVEQFYRGRRRSTYPFTIS